MRKLQVLFGAIICAMSCEGGSNLQIDINDYNGTYYVCFAETSLETYHNSWSDREFYQWDESLSKPMYFEDSHMDNPMVFSLDFKNKLFVFWGFAYTVTDLTFDVTYEESEEHPGGEYICTATFHADKDDALYEFVDMGSEGITLLVTNKFDDEEYYSVWIYHAYCTYQEAIDFNKQ